MYGDTAFNSWPVPLVPLANMPKATQHVDDDFFANDAAEDSGTEDGSGSAAVQDLGEMVIPFPREMSEMLTREMIHVFDIDVGIFFTPGSGKSLMAIICENRRAVAIVKNKDHREFVMNRLCEGVRALNLAPDTRPPKPQELTEWESARGTGAQAGAAAPLLGGTPAARDAAPGGQAPLPKMPPMVPPPQVLSPPATMPMVPPPVVSPTGAAPAPTSEPVLAAFGASVLR